MNAKQIKGPMAGALVAALVAGSGLALAQAPVPGQQPAEKAKQAADMDKKKAEEAKKQADKNAKKAKATPQPASTPQPAPTPKPAS